MTQKQMEISGYSGGAIEINRGASLKVTDMQGSQIADFFALNGNDHWEYLSTSITRSENRNLFPKPGAQFYSTYHRPILTFVEDHSPGIHDMLFAPCDQESYANQGLADHPNCRDNYLSAASGVGISHQVVPDPFNIFQNTPVTAEGALELGLAVSQPGDYVVMKAEIDLVVIVTACSSKRVNGGGSTPISVEIID